LRLSFLHIRSFKVTHSLALLFCIDIDSLRRYICYATMYQQPELSHLYIIDRYLMLIPFDLIVMNKLGRLLLCSVLAVASSFSVSVSLHHEAVYTD